MMKSLAKFMVLAFFALTAYNQFVNVEEKTQKFADNYTKFTETIEERFKVKLPLQLTHEFVNQHAHNIVYYTSIAKMVFAALGLISGSLGSIAVLIHFLGAMICMNFAAITFTSLVNLEPYFRTVAFFFASSGFLCLEGCSTTPCSTSKAQTGVDNSQARGKKRN